MKVKKCEKKEKAFAIPIPTAVLQMQSENVLGYLMFSLDLIQESNWQSCLVAEQDKSCG